MDFSVIKWHGSMPVYSPSFLNVALILCHALMFTMQWILPLKGILLLQNVYIETYLIGNRHGFAMFLSQLWQLLLVDHGICTRYVVEEKADY